MVDDESFGKPRDDGDAFRMLRTLSGRAHQVITGVCLISPKKSGIQRASTAPDVRCETTRVSMSKISDEEIRSYIASREPMDKAGAYAIQGVASRWVSKIEGNYFNVVGLPISLVWQMLKNAGWER